MTDLRIYPMPFNTVQFIYGERDSIQIDPEYQRLSDIWSLDKRQLLIDSLLNEYDLPKLYFHEFLRPKTIDDSILRYAIIDGKQRLESIWSFIEGAFPLSDEFEYIHDESVQAAGMTYADLAQYYPKLKSRFDATQLPIILIQTEDTELIEEMFSRLNEAVPLTAPEKRNALGGALPPVIREIARHELFTEKIPYTNRRYRHYDLATKFLYFEFSGGIEDTKKVYLDWFARVFQPSSRDSLEYWLPNPSISVSQVAPEIAQEVTAVLDTMAPTFITSDKLLSSVGMGVLYYLMFRQARAEGWALDISRSVLARFETIRLANRKEAEEDIRNANYELLEFDRLSQSPNDAVAIHYRFDVLTKNVRVLINEAT